MVSEPILDKGEKGEGLSEMWMRELKDGEDKWYKGGAEYWEVTLRHLLRRWAAE